MLLEIFCNEVIIFIKNNTTNDVKIQITVINENILKTKINTLYYFS